MPTKSRKPMNQKLHTDAKNMTWTQICEFFNDIYRVTAHQNGLPQRCKRRDCRTSFRCQAMHVLGADCGAVSDVNLIQHMLWLVEYRLMLQNVCEGTDGEPDYRDIKSLFDFVVAEIAPKNPTMTLEEKHRLTSSLNVHKHAQTRITAYSHAQHHCPSR